MNSEDKGFIKQTARDYDLPFEVVERIFKLSKTTEEYYERLESEIN